MLQGMTAGLLALLLLYFPGIAEAQSGNASIYSSVIERLAGDVALPSEILVRDSSVAAQIPLQVKEADSELVDRLVAKSAQVVPSKELGLPANVRLISATEARAFFQAASERVYVFSLSPIVYSDDGSKAAVYIEVHCGGLCGSGAGFVLTRNGVRWDITGLFIGWVS